MCHFGSLFKKTIYLRFLKSSLPCSRANHRLWQRISLLLHSHASLLLLVVFKAFYCYKKNCSHISLVSIRVETVQFFYPLKELNHSCHTDSWVYSGFSGNFSICKEAVCWIPLYSSYHVYLLHALLSLKLSFFQMLNVLSKVKHSPEPAKSSCITYRWILKLNVCIAWTIYLNLTIAYTFSKYVSGLSWVENACKDSNSLPFNRFCQFPPLFCLLSSCSFLLSTMTLKGHSPRGLCLWGNKEQMDPGKYSLLQSKQHLYFISQAKIFSAVSDMMYRINQLNANVSLLAISSTQHENSME